VSSGDHLLYEYINHNSALIALIIFVIGVAFFAWTYKRNLFVLLPALLIASLAIFVFFNAQYGHSDVTNTDELNIFFESNRPFIVQIYSDSCAMCLLSKNSVDELDRNIDGEVALLRLNLSEKIGRMVARQYQVTVTPTFLIFDGFGNVAFRQSGYPDIAKIEETALSLKSS
tara:strand:- start:9941 stop:10456 length:516 start_codon:yes stop_codon:yes gene_type:complete